MPRSDVRPRRMRPKGRKGAARRETNLSEVTLLHTCGCHCHCRSHCHCHCLQCVIDTVIVIAVLVLIAVVSFFVVVVFVIVVVVVVRVFLRSIASRRLCPIASQPLQLVVACTTP